MDRRLNNNIGKRSLCERMKMDFRLFKNYGRTLWNILQKRDYRQNL